MTERPERKVPGDDVRSGHKEEQRAGDAGDQEVDETPPAVVSPGAEKNLLKHGLRLGRAPTVEGKRAVAVSAMRRRRPQRPLLGDGLGQAADDLIAPARKRGFVSPLPRALDHFIPLQTRLMNPAANHAFLRRRLIVEVDGRFGIELEAGAANGDADTVTIGATAASRAAARP